MDAVRAASVAALRARLSRMGGLATPGSLGSRGLRSAPSGAAGAGGLRSGSAAPEADPRRAAAERLGFVPERHGDGIAWVRRVTVELAGFLERAGAPGPVSAAELLDLVHAGGLTSRLAATAGDDEPHGAGTTADAPTGPPGSDQCTVLDIETLGLRGSGVVAFLVGLGTPRGTTLVVDQLLLADMSEEAALLGALLTRLESTRVLVTYNGRTFDVPVLRSRCIITRVGGERLETMTHADLLRPVRRLFRDRLGVCTLRQAELGLLGFERDGDVPGAEAPEHFRAFLHRADAAALAGVVRHNELDLCATMVLAARVAAHCAGELVQPVHPADRYNLAAHLDRHTASLAEDAASHYRAAVRSAGHPWDRQAGHRLSRHLARGGVADREEAIAVLRRLWQTDHSDLRAARALCILEERARRLEDALGVAEAALDVCHRLGPFRLTRMRAVPRGGWASDWERRRARLSIRLSRAAARGVEGRHIDARCGPRVETLELLPLGVAG